MPVSLSGVILVELERAEGQIERKATAYGLPSAGVTDHAVGGARQILSARNRGGVLQRRWNTGGIGRTILGERDFWPGANSIVRTAQHKTAPSTIATMTRTVMSVPRAAPLLWDPGCLARFMLILPARTSRSIGRRLRAMPVRHRARCVARAVRPSCRFLRCPRCLTLLIT